MSLMQMTTSHLTTTATKRHKKKEMEENYHVVFMRINSVCQTDKQKTILS